MSQTTKHPIGLSDRALALVQRHAAALPVVLGRDAKLAEIAIMLDMVCGF